jgi:hypothetical protein
MGTDGARYHAIPFDMPGPLALVRFPLDRLFPVMKLSPRVVDWKTVWCAMAGHGWIVSMTDRDFYKSLTDFTSQWVKTSLKRSEDVVYRFCRVCR